jgi:hypothetical protein
MKLQQLLNSRKLWSSLIGLAIALGAAYGIDIPQEKLTAILQTVAIIVAGYNVGTGIESGLSAQKAPGRFIAAGPSDFERRMSQKTGAARQSEPRGSDA